MNKFYYLHCCLRCGLIDSSDNLKPWSHTRCPQKNYQINRSNIFNCYHHILLTPIPTSPKTKAEHDRFWFCINFINQYPNLEAPTTMEAIAMLNGMMREH